MTQASVPGMTTQDTTAASMVAGTGEAPAARRGPSHNPDILDAVLRETEKYRLAIDPTTMEEAWVDAQRVFKAGLCGVTSVEDAYARIKIGRALGMSVWAAVQSIDVIESRPCLKSKAKVGLCQRSNVLEYFRMISTSDVESTWEGKRHGEPPIRFQYTIEMAKTALLLDRGKTEEARKTNNWNKHPAAMLRARASGQLADIIANDVCLGLPGAEEMEDVRADRLEREARGEVPVQPIAPPPQAAPSRDWDSERAILLHRINDAVSLESLKPIRIDIGKFIEEAPAEHGDAVKAQYNKTMSALKQSAT
jgi:hypothetical protein